MPPFRGQRGLRLRLVGAVANLLLFIIIYSFLVGCYRWAFQINRGKSITLNPVSFPGFEEIHVTTPELKERFYRLLRVYDFVADEYSAPRKANEFPRVPVIYVHGNGGSYHCARSFSRFLLESNVRRRVRALRLYDERVKQYIFSAYEENRTLEPLRAGQRVPAWLQKEAEDTILTQETPILGTELYSLDFLEESNTHSAAITMKETRFLNHSLHTLMRRFAAYYEPLTATAPKPLRLADQVATHRTASNSTALASIAERIENEYKTSTCSYIVFPTSPTACRKSAELCRTFDTVERIRLEVARVKQKGIWMWAESYGGVVSTLEALLHPELVAGIVFLSSPILFPPLLFEKPKEEVFRAVVGAAASNYPWPYHTLTEAEKSVNWSRIISLNMTALQLVHSLGSVPQSALAERIRNTTLISISGGAMDDVTPSIATFVLRATPRALPTPKHEAFLQLCPTGGYHRDVSTEMLRGCGTAIDHRGLVYSSQFLRSAADSVVEAALVPSSERRFGMEASFQKPYHERVFPTIVDALLPQQEKASRFAELLTLDNQSRYVLETEEQQSNEPDEARAHGQRVCVSSPLRIDWNHVASHPIVSVTGFYDGAFPLPILLGVTTYGPEHVHYPEMRLFADKEELEQLVGVRARAATKLHLPTVHKYTSAVDGETLRTVYSFVLEKKNINGDSVGAPTGLPGVTWARFCFTVKQDTDEDVKKKSNVQHHTFIQYNMVRPAVSAQRRRFIYLAGVPVYNEYNILTVDGVTLVEGVRISTLETSLQITVSPHFSTFPVVMAGTMHSFFGGLRGNDHIALDEPEPQLQFFYGPYERKYAYTYSWRPFTTELRESDETFMIYVIADPSEPLADVSMASLEMLQSSYTSPVVFLNWLLFEWPERLLSFYASRSAIAGHGGSHVALFFATLFKCGSFYRGFYKDEEERVRRMPRVTRLLYKRSNFLVYLLLITPILEFATGIGVSNALQRCLAPDSSSLNADEITALMSWREKLALMMLMMRPHYSSCNWPWFKLQVVPSWSSFFEHLATLYFGFFLTALFYLILHIFVAICAFVWFPISRFVLRPLLWRHPRKGLVVLVFLWAIPTIVHLSLPVVPPCFITMLSSICFIGACTVVSSRIRPNVSFLHTMVDVTTALAFNSHYEGLVLTIRNMLVTTDKRIVLDPERYEVRFWSVYAMFQFFCLYGYIFCFLGTQHEYTVRQLELEDGKKSGSERLTDAEVREGLDGKRAKCLKDYRYLFGDIGKRYPLFRRIISLCTYITSAMMFFSAIVMLRRPIEGYLGVTSIIFVFASFLCFMGEVV